MMASFIALSVTGYFLASKVIPSPVPPRVAGGEGCGFVVLGPELDPNYPEHRRLPDSQRIARALRALTEDRRELGPHGIVAFAPTPRDETYVAPIALPQGLAVDPRALVDQHRDGLARVELRLPEIDQLKHRFNLLYAGTRWIGEWRAEVKTGERRFRCRTMEVLFLPAASELQLLDRSEADRGQASNLFNRFCPSNTRFVLVNDGVVVPRSVAGLNARNLNFLSLSLADYRELLRIERHLVLVDVSESIYKPSTREELRSTLASVVLPSFRARVPNLPHHLAHVWIFGERILPVDRLSLDQIQGTPSIPGDVIDKADTGHTDLVELLDFLKAKPQERRSAWIFTDAQHRPTDSTRDVDRWMKDERCEEKLSRLETVPPAAKRWAYLQLPQQDAARQADSPAPYPDPGDVRKLRRALECLGFEVVEIRSTVDPQAQAQCPGWSTGTS